MAKGTALTQTLTVKRSEQEPESLEVLADSIIRVADALELISHGPLVQRAVLLLLHDVTKVPLRDIALVINAAPKLRQFVRRRQ